MKKIVPRTSLVAALVVATVSTGIAAPAEASSSRASRVTLDAGSVKLKGVENSTPEELFRGIYFLQGDVASTLISGTDFEELPGFSDARAGFDRPEARDFANRVTTEVGGESSEDLHDWADEITSGDPFRVEAAFEEGNALVRDSKTVKQALSHSHETYRQGGLDPL